MSERGKLQWNWFENFSTKRKKLSHIHTTLIEIFTTACCAKLSSVETLHMSEWNQQ